MGWDGMGWIALSSGLPGIGRWWGKSEFVQTARMKERMGRGSVKRGKTGKITSFKPRPV